ncbi:MAG: 16S rRNA (cytosine(967)-C(5))-methyltransferase RsmB [Clostridia bacterium]|nr:16S rRNA (cytosine(967)-C(5))-methyltransferase RsmB [Clostridia bacterium]
MKDREIAYQILMEIEEGAYANLVLDRVLRLNKQLYALDRGLITELVYGTVKYRAKLDWLIGETVKKAEKLEKGPRVLLRLSFYQLLFLDHIPPFAVTNEAVKLAKKYFHSGVASLINGVLRNYLRNPEKVILPDAQKNPLEYLEIVYSHPRWMLERWLNRYGWDNTVKLCEYNNAPADLWIRVNTLKITREELATKLMAEGCDVSFSSRVQEGILLKSSPPLASLSSFKEGLFTVQDESSMLVAHVVNPQPKQTVLDVCAGPGGKTTHLAQLMKNQGEILACDVHQHRIGLIKENAKRLGIEIIKTKLLDATGIAQELKQKFSLVLVDAPCSGLGVLRRRPDSRWHKQPEEVLQLAELQTRILASVYHLLAPGGRLIYSTCTIEPEENFEVIAKFLAEHPDLESFDLTPYFPYVATTAAEKEELKKGLRQFLPFQDGMEGFFIAGLHKKF